jgi:hypothetical protein
MQRLQRKVGRFMPNRSPNEADIEAMLRDFNDSDQMLEKVSLPQCFRVSPGTSSADRRRLKPQQSNGAMPGPTF